METIERKKEKANTDNKDTTTTNDVIDIGIVFLLLISNNCYTFFWYFCCWIWTGKCLLDKCWKLHKIGKQMSYKKIVIQAKKSGGKTIQL